MSSSSAVRIIMKKTSLETFKQSSEEINELMKKANVNKTYGVLIYLGWDNISNYYVDILSHAITNLSCENLTYRFTIVGEQYSNIDEQHYTSKEDENLGIPFPSMIRTFDENDMENQMKYFVDEEKSQEEIEI